MRYNDPSNDINKTINNSIYFKQNTTYVVINSNPAIKINSLDNLDQYLTVIDSEQNKEINQYICFATNPQAPTTNSGSYDVQVSQIDNSDRSFLVAAKLRSIYHINFDNVQVDDISLIMDNVNVNQCTMQLSTSTGYKHIVTPVNAEVKITKDGVDVIVENDEIYTIYNGITIPIDSGSTIRFNSSIIFNSENLENGTSYLLQWMNGTANVETSFYLIGQLL